MRKLFSAFMGLILLTTGAAAQTAMTGAEFDAYTRNKTLTYMMDGTSYGAEQYLPDRKVIWAFENDDCLHGTWREPEPGLICFSYPQSGDTDQCWRFYQTPRGLEAEFAGETEGTVLYEARQSPTPLLCLGPKVGA